MAPQAAPADPPTTANCANPLLSRPSTHEPVARPDGVWEPPAGDGRTGAGGVVGVRMDAMVQYRDPGPIAFDAVIARPDGPGAFVTFPFSALDTFGVRSKVPVKARFDGTVDYTGSLAPYGGEHRLGVRKDVQDSLGKSYGDPVHVEIW